MKKTVLKNYAKLIAKVGANVRRGDEVLINAETDQPDFIYYLVDECYKAGAKKVNVDFHYQPLEKLHVRHRSLSVLSKLEDWEIKKLEHRRDNLPVMIHVISEDPDGLVGINQEKYAKAMQARYKVIKPIRDAMENKYKWVIAAVPGVDWAKKVFPKESKHRAVEKLWEAILYTSRATDDPIKAWEEHNADLAKRCEYLNCLGIKALEYKASNGTDLRVGMMDNSLFLGGGEYTISGEFFNPNIPTEEVFITPKKGDAEGIVYSSKPLSYRGQLIENFSIRFEGGKAVEVHAEKNEELLKQMISMDEGAAYLGECALVPYDSPIRNSEITFFNTLFDENAACHLALGMGYSNSVKDYDKYTLEECQQMGVNDSIIHEDFMIGTKDLSITAITHDGKKIQIFKDGNWAF